MQQGTVCNVGGHALPALRRGGELFAIPWRMVRKGGCSMTFEQVVLLLSLLGGAIYITFEISWTIFNNKKK